MKKILVILTLFFVTFNILNAQKNEYRYFALKTGLSHNYNFMGNKNNENVLMTTPIGDMKKIASGINYIPGVFLDLNYHIDMKSDKYGIVLGLDLQNSGFCVKYATKLGEYKLTDQFRVQSVGIPIFFKFGGRNIYINQQYLFVGVQYNFYLVSQNIQKPNWQNKRYYHTLTNESRKSGVAAFLGFNYFIYNFQLEFWPVNYINSEYTEQRGLNNANYQPYKNLPKFNYFIKTGINVPMNRWLTTKSWRAEKIRRALSFGGA